jgi:hypothetical protein
MLPLVGAVIGAVQPTQNCAFLVQPHGSVQRIEMERKVAKHIRNWTDAPEQRKRAGATPAPATRARTATE